MGSTELLQIAPQIWALVLQWLCLHWPWLLLILVVIPLIAFWDRVVGFWDWLVEWDGGRWWPIPAALLPPVLALSSRVQSEHKYPLLYQIVTVTLLLLAIAILQSYGQARAERYRKLADAAIGRISAGVERIADGITAAAAATEEDQEG